jgi:transposase
MRQPNDLSRRRVARKQDATVIAVIETSQSSWLVAGMVPEAKGLPLKKLVVDEEVAAVWIAGARKQRAPATPSSASPSPMRFWLARWLVHIKSKPSSVAVPRKDRAPGQGAAQASFSGLVAGNPTTAAWL